jgi:hypothetical protein
MNRVQGFGLLLAAAALGLLAWGLQRPAMWLDESATVVATRRTWSGLWSLLHGAEAPLVPYYAMLKLVTSVVGGLVPGAGPGPELLYRSPSVLATVLAVWALAVWVGTPRHLGLMLCSSAALLLTAGFSRFGQEARPYAFALLMAVLSTIAWDRMTGDPRRRWIVGYALAVVLLLTAHLLATSLVIAHLVAAAAGGSRANDVAGSGPDRRAAVRRTVIGIGLGLTLAAPFAGWAATHGVGPTKANSVTLDHLTKAFVGLFTGADATPGFVLMLVLASIGTVRAVPLGRLLPSSRKPGPADPGDPSDQALSHTRLARIAAAWAFVPPLVLLPPLIVRPNLLIGRYLVFVLPGWAILTGLGAVTVAEVVRRTVQQLAPKRAGLSAVAGGSAIVLVLTALVFAQIDPLNRVRLPGGHSEDVRPALAAANRPEYADLPIMLSSRFSSLEVVTYDRKAEARIIGQQIPRSTGSIWPVADLQPSSPARLILLLRTPSPARCKARSHGSAVAYARRCLPKSFKEADYTVETAESAGHRWTFIVLTRSAASRSTRPAEPAGRS